MENSASSRVTAATSFRGWRGHEFDTFRRTTHLCPLEDSEVTGNMIKSALHYTVGRARGLRRFSTFKLYGLTMA